jgi:DNA-binding NarL/FixJ family response regulator
MTSIRVFCVDDHEFMHDGLESRLALESDIECVGHAESADGLAQRIAADKPDVVLLDLEMPGADPFSAIEDLRSQCPDARVIILSAYVRDHFLDQAIDRGAWGYFSKGDSPGSLIEGIRRVAGGQTAFGPNVQDRVHRDSAGAATAPGDEPAPTGSRLKRLSSRELEVLRLVGRGMSRADIARTMHRSIKTVDAHHTSIMKKLDIHDRAELAIFAVRENLVEE